VREEDLVARLGGDEFGVLLAEVTDPAIAARVAQRILDITSLPVLLRDELATSLRASLGIALFPDAGQTPDALLRAADSAMYAAKAKGGGYLLCSPETESEGNKQVG
jgi:diguanylate cyclase (GGDEF)-like protein